MLSKIIFITLTCHTIASDKKVCFQTSTIKDKQVEVKGCCYGYYKDGGICRECPNGYTGVGCKSRCFYPDFGRKCKSKCNCTEQRCNHVTGCVVLSTIREFQTSPATVEQETATGTYLLDTRSHQQEQTENDEGHGDGVWLYIVIISSILVLVLIALLVKYRYGNACARKYTLQQSGLVVDMRHHNIDTNLRHPERSDVEEDVYCEIRESMMVDNVLPSNVLTCHQNVNDVIMMDRRCTARDNFYHHLHFNNSLPNLIEVTEYAHAETFRNKVLNKSDNHLSEVRKSPERLTSIIRQSWQEDECLKNYGQIWKNN